MVDFFYFLATNIESYDPKIYFGGAIGILLLALVLTKGKWHLSVIIAWGILFHIFLFFFIWISHLDSIWIPRKGNSYVVDVFIESIPFFIFYHFLSLISLFLSFRFFWKRRQTTIATISQSDISIRKTSKWVIILWCLTTAMTYFYFWISS